MDSTVTGPQQTGVAANGAGNADGLDRLEAIVQCVSTLPAETTQADRADAVKKGSLPFSEVEEASAKETRDMRKVPLHKLSPSEIRDVLDRTHRMMGIFIEGSKAYAQLATGGIVACAFLVGEKANSSLFRSGLFLPCLLWAVALFFASAYPVAAAKWLEAKEDGAIHLTLGFSKKDMPWWSMGLFDNPSRCYNWLMVSFYLGAVSFVVVVFGDDVLRLFRYLRMSVSR